MSQIKNDANEMIRLSSGITDPRAQQAIRKAGETILKLVKEIEKLKNEIEDME